MYPVSAAYRAAMMRPVQKFGLSGTVGAVPFTEADVLAFSWENQCSDGTRLAIGQVYVGQIRVAFSAAFARSVPRYSWAGAVITPSVLMDVSGETDAAPVWESVPLGVFTVPADGVATIQGGVEVTAYDNLAKLDRIPAVSRSIGLKPYDMAKRYTDRVELQLGQTQAEFEALPNGGEKVYIAVEESGKTGRDVFAWLGEFLGCFCTAGRDGKIYFRPYSRTVVDTLDPAHRWQGARFGDYVTRYSMVRCTVTEYGHKTNPSGTESKQISREERVLFAALPEEEYLRYDLGKNPFLQAEPDAVITSRLHNILAALQAVQYVPFETTAIGNPAYDLGDVIQFPGGIGDSSKLFCITQFSYTHNQGCRMSGAGENPELANAKSGEYKELASEIAATSTLGGRGELYLRNQGRVVIEDGAEPVEVIGTVYSTASGSQVEIRAEIQAAVETTVGGSAADGLQFHSAEVLVTYISDGETVVDRKPVEDYLDGDKIIALLYDFETQRGSEHEFRIFLSCTGGNVTVEAGQALMSLTGISVGEAVSETGDDWPVEPETDEISHIEVVQPPTKTEYMQGEAIDLTGVQIAAVTYGGIASYVTGSCIFTPADGDLTETPGPLLINALYQADGRDFRASFDLTVIKDAPDTIVMQSPPDKLEYVVGEAIDLTGLKVVAMWDDGREQDVTAECETNPPEGTVVQSPGIFIMEILYDGQLVDQLDWMAVPAPVTFYEWAEASGAPPELTDPERYEEYAAQFEGVKQKSNGTFDVEIPPIYVYGLCEMRAPLSPYWSPTFFLYSDGSPITHQDSELNYDMQIPSITSGHFNLPYYRPLLREQYLTYGHSTKSKMYFKLMVPPPLSNSAFTKISEPRLTGRVFVYQQGWVSAETTEPIASTWEIIPNGENVVITLNVNAPYGITPRIYNQAEFTIISPVFRATPSETVQTIRAGSVPGGPVDEVNKTFTNPVTGEVRQYDTFEYDFKTRTYTFTIPNSQEIVVVKYSDEVMQFVDDSGTYNAPYPTE